MPRYACPNPGCPRRDPVTAPTAPTCYTCAQPMAEVADWAPSTPYEVDQRVVSGGQVHRVTHVGLVDDPPNRECRLEIPEPTPEQRASRTLPPITIEVTPTAPADVEAFLRDLQAEILRALTTIDRVPHDQPVTFRVEEPSR